MIIIDIEKALDELNLTDKRAVLESLREQIKNSPAPNDDIGKVFDEMRRNAVKKLEKELEGE